MQIKNKRNEKSEKAEIEITKRQLLIKGDSLFFIICFITIAIITVLYRLLLIKDYYQHYVDEDQALLWYGCVAASRLEISEPHFLGQSYGSMLESVVAVPFYFLGIDLSWSLPLATALFWVTPFVLLGICTFKYNKTLSIFIMICPLLWGWDYDLVTGMPRSFIPGFCFSVIGIILLLCLDSISSWFLAPIFLTIGFINTESTITVCLLTILFIILYERQRVIRHWKELLLGGLVSIFLLIYCNNLFYHYNSEYNLHGTLRPNLSLVALIDNYENGFEALKSFSVFNIYSIPIALLLIITLIICGAVYYKEYRLLVIVFCAIIGSMLFFSLNKSLDFVTGDLYFSQLRMFLFIPYVIALLLFFLAIRVQPKMKNEKAYISILTLIVIFIASYKTFYFQKNILPNDKMLGNSQVIGVEKTSDVFSLAHRLRDLAEQKNCNIAVQLSDNRTLGYATGAINHDDYVSYNATYDRRTSTYLSLKDSEIQKRVLMYEYNRQNDIEATVITVKGNLIEYIEEKYGLTRRV